MTGIMFCYQTDGLKPEAACNRPFYGIKGYMCGPNRYGF